MRSYDVGARLCRSSLASRALHFQSYRPDLVIWAWIKQKVTKENKTFKIADVLALTNKAISAVTLDQWCDACQHCKKLVDEFWVNDCLQEEVIEKLVIDVGLESDDGESDVDDGSQRVDDDGEDGEIAIEC